MVTCTKIPITLPIDNPPTKLLIRDIVGCFFSQEWPNVDLETIAVTFNMGYSDTNCSVSRPQPSDNTTPKEPLKVFLKIHRQPEGDIDAFKHLTPKKHEEAQLCQSYGASGQGAKLYAFFETQNGVLGRLDEFLDARTLEPEDVEDQVIRADIARAHAAFHAMDPGLEPKPVELYYQAVTAGLDKYHRSDKLKALAREGGHSLDDMIDYDFTSRIRLIVTELDSMGAKTGWCIHDVQYLNVMVKSSPLKPGESRVALIDFEFVFRNYRAFDIGGHYMQKLFKWFDEEDKLAKCRPYTEEEKRHFCDEYARRWNEVTGDEDNGEEVFREAELGYMLAITFDVHNMLSWMDGQLDKDPLNLAGFRRLFREFVGQYEKLGLE